MRWMSSPEEKTEDGEDVENRTKEEGGDGAGKRTRGSSLIVHCLSRGNVYLFREEGRPTQTSCFVPTGRTHTHTQPNPRRRKKTGKTRRTVSSPLRGIIPHPLQPTKTKTSERARSSSSSSSSDLLSLFVSPFRTSNVDVSHDHSSRPYIQVRRIRMTYYWCSGDFLPQLKVECVPKTSV